VRISWGLEMRRDEVLVEVDNLRTYFPVKGGIFVRKIAEKDQPRV